MKMNAELFKIHVASRKITPEPLRTAEFRLTLPPGYTSGCNTALLAPCRVLFSNLDQGTQSVIISIPDKSNILDWVNTFAKYDRKDMRLSRFQRAYGGMMNPPIRVWEKQSAKYVRSNNKVKVGSLVQCGCTVRESKGRVYFDLHRDIVLLETGTKPVHYFSDDDV